MNLSTRMRKRWIWCTSLAFQCLVIEIKVILDVFKHFHLLFHVLNKSNNDAGLNPINGQKRISSTQLCFLWGTTPSINGWKLTCTRLRISWRLCSRICCFSVTTVPLGFAAWPSCKKPPNKHFSASVTLLMINLGHIDVQWVYPKPLSTCATVEAVWSSRCSSHRQRATMRAISIGFSRYLLCRCCLILRRLCW